jgi:shikimate dehydrogenase
MKADKATNCASGPIKLALFGTPIKSSLSPYIHGQFAQQAGMEVDYRLIETGPESFPEQLEAFRLSGGVGCNITLPLKHQAWQLAAKASASVMQAQAANTLVHRPSGGWMAHTTDGVGFINDLKLNHGVRVEGQRVLVLGAGGAAAGIMGNLLDESPHAIVVVNRNVGRANKMIRQFDHSNTCSTSSWESVATLPGFGLIINATSVGHQGQLPKLSKQMFADGAVCYDLNYFTASLPLKKYCETMGVRYFDGLGMLVEQAAKSFSLWTGFQPETRQVISDCVNRMPAQV